MHGSYGFRNVVQYDEVVEPLPEVFWSYAGLPDFIGYCIFIIDRDGEAGEKTCPEQTLNKLWQCVRCMKYTVILEPQDEGGYTVIVPSLPGCISEGDTRDEALENIRDAIKGYMASLKKHGEPIPHEEFSHAELMEVSVVA